MSETSKLPETERAACEICLKEISDPSAIGAEGADYFVHFCGLDCYEQWKQQNKKRMKAEDQ